MDTSSRLPLRHLLGVAVILGMAACERAVPRGGSTAATEVSAESVERGQYLVEGLLQCFYCHSERRWDLPGAPADSRPGAGRIYIDNGETRLVARNITPDDETGIGLWSDEELDRAIRRGISRDGRQLSTAMPFQYFRHLPDRDLAAVVAFLRSRDPVHNPLPPTVLSPELRAAAEAREPVTLDPLDLQGSDPVEVGRNLVRISRCQGCHTAWEAPRMPGYFAGGNIADLGQGPTDDPEPQGSFTSNLTPHASGLSYDAETFTLFMRTGRGGSLSGAMPWTVFRHLSDSDLGAIYTFLRTLHPVAHHVNNIDEPTFCVVCEQVHGGGALNEPYEPPPSLTLTTSDLERYAGTFHASEYDWTVELSLADGRLLVRVDPEPTSDGEPGSEAIVLTRTRLLIPDEGAVDVELDSDSIAARLITVDADAVVLERVR